MEGITSGMNAVLVSTTILITILCGILIFTLINTGLKLRDKWKLELKDDFLDWYWLCKKNAAIRRINVNKYKLSRLAEVEDTPTPEMIAIVDKVSKDVDFVKSYVVEEEPEEDIVKPITEECIAITGLICDKIDEMILLEVQNLLLPLASTGNGIDVRNYANYIETVSTAVYNGLNPDVYSANTMFVAEYFNSYIIKKSSVVILTTMTSLNQSLPPTT